MNYIVSLHRQFANHPPHHCELTELTEPYISYDNVLILIIGSCDATIIQSLLSR